MSKRTDIIIEGTTASWSINLEGEVSGTYTGTFRFRCFLNPTQKIAANREMRSLLGEHPMLVPEHESFLAYALSQLKYRVISAPPFWNSNDGYSGDIPDTNIITEILNAAIDSELKYKGQLNERKLEALNRSIEAAKRIQSKLEGDAEIEKEIEEHDAEAAKEE